MTNKSKMQSMRPNNEQIKKKSPLRFIRKRDHTRYDQPLKPLPMGSPLSSARLYHRITQLPLSNFIDCDIDENFSSLIIEGEPTEEELLYAWLLIKTQYADVIGNQEYVLYKNACRDLNVLKITLIEIETLVSLMRKVYSPKIGERLNKLLKSNFRFNVDDPEQYKRDLDGCITRSGSTKIMIDIKAALMSSMEGKQEKGQKPTREYYHKMLISLSDHAKYELTDKISVFDFCERVKRYNKYCEQQKQNNGRRAFR